MQRSNLSIKDYKFYKDCRVWCYEHRRFEGIIQWRSHNDEEEFIAIQDTILDRCITKRIGNIEFIILPREGIISSDRILDKDLEVILSRCIVRLLENDGIYINNY